MADALTNRSTLANDPTIIADRAVYYYDKTRLFSRLIGDRYRYQVPEGSSAIVVNQMDYLTFAAHTEATAQDSEAYTHVSRTLTPVIHSTNILVGLESLLSGQDQYGIIEEFAEAAATAWAKYEDSDSTYGFAADYAEAPSTTPDHEIGTDATALSAPLIRQGVALLLAAGARRPYHYAIDPIQFEELMRDQEAKQFLHDTRGPTAAAAATFGVQPDRYLGQLYGAYVWVADAMIESSGLHSMMFAQGAMGQAYKLIGYQDQEKRELMVDVAKKPDQIGYRVTFAIFMDIDGIAFTSTTNKFIVDIIS